VSDQDREILLAALEDRRVKGEDPCFSRLQLGAMRAEEGVPIEPDISDVQKVPVSGLSLAVSPYRVNTSSPTTGIKSLNYLDRILSRDEARSRDFDEAVVLNERGEIVSATTANIFWSKNGTLHTPNLSSGALAGVTRECVMEIAERHFVPLLEGVYEMNDLTDADQIFLTSSVIGVTPVTTFDFRRYAIESGSVCGIIRDAFESTARGSSPAVREGP